MLGLIASVIALYFGALIYQAFARLKRFERFISGLILATIGGIVLLEVLPELIDNHGYAITLPLILGFVGPSLIERLFRNHADRTHKIVIFLGILGLIIHTYFDGVALSSEFSNYQHFEHLAIAIVAHRIPVGLTVWWLLSSFMRTLSALSVVTLMALTTVFGYYSAASIISFEHSALIAFIQAFVAGSLLHVVYFRPHSDGCSHAAMEHHEHKQKDKRFLEPWSLAGIFSGCLIFVVLTKIHIH